jgi:hypothetical protein
MNSQRPFIGQLPSGTPTASAPAPKDILAVSVTKDDAPLAGVPVEVMLASGDTKTGVTDGSGLFALTYTAAQKGQTVVRILPPDGVEDIGEDSAKGVELKGGPASVQFALVGVAPSPLIGLGVAGALYGLVLAAF